MATENRSSVNVVPLNGSNYATWKIQCRMALIKDGLWSIVNGTEEAPGEDAAAERRTKFAKGLVTFRDIVTSEYKMRRNLLQRTSMKRNTEFTKWK